MGLEAHLAVGRNPFYAAIGGDALLKAALHQLGVITLPLHLRKREGAAKAMALRRNTQLARKVKTQHHFGLLWRGEGQGCERGHSM